jgi:hypothetical protein
MVPYIMDTFNYPVGNKNYHILIPSKTDKKENKKTITTSTHIRSNAHRVPTNNIHKKC